MMLPYKRGCQTNVALDSLSRVRPTSPKLQGLRIVATDHRDENLDCVVVLTPTQNRANSAV